MTGRQGGEFSRRGFIGAASALALIAPRSSGGKNVAGPPLKYHLFLPASDSAKPLLVLVHGVSTKPETLIELLAVDAAEHGRPLMTPDFDDDVFDEYQRLGSSKAPLESARALVAALGQAFTRIGRPQAPVDLMGFSGGAQFVHRFGLFFPKMVRRLVISSPGWYTWLDEKEPYPYGVAPSAQSENLTPDVAAFLRLPKLVTVGEDDTKRDVQLRTGRADAQGRTRLERARHWVDHVNEQAERRGGVRTRLEVLANTPHSVTRAVRKGGLGRKMFNFLEGEAPPLLPARPAGQRP
jgi:pimeloyl-ACP methyl ester carboxylesterase